MANQFFRQPIAGVPGSGQAGGFERLMANRDISSEIGDLTGTARSARAAQFGKVAGPALGVLGTAQTIAGASGDPTTDLLSGGASGAATGAMFGPIGAIVGGVLGAAGTAIMGGSKKRKAAKSAEKANRATAFNNLISILQGRGTQAPQAQAPQIVGDPIGAAAGGLQALQGLQDRKTALATAGRQEARADRRIASQEGQASLRADQFNRTLGLQKEQLTSLEGSRTAAAAGRKAALAQDVAELKFKMDNAPTQAERDLAKELLESRIASTDALMMQRSSKAAGSKLKAPEGLKDVFEVQ